MKMKLRDKITEIRDRIPEIAVLSSGENRNVIGGPKKGFIEKPEADTV